MSDSWKRYQSMWDGGHLRSSEDVLNFLSARFPALTSMGKNPFQNNNSKFISSSGGSEAESPRMQLPGIGSSLVNQLWQLTSLKRGKDSGQVPTKDFNVRLAEVERIFKSLSGDKMSDTDLYDRPAYARGSGGSAGGYSGSWVDSQRNQDRSQDVAQLRGWIEEIPKEQLSGSEFNFLNSFRGGK